MKSLLETRLYSVDRMLKPGEEEGEIPPHSQIYRNFFKVGWPSALEAVLVSLVGMVDTVMAVSYTHLNLSLIIKGRSS